MQGPGSPSTNGQVPTVRSANVPRRSRVACNGGRVTSADRRRVISAQSGSTPPARRIVRTRSRLYPVRRMISTCATPAVASATIAPAKADLVSATRFRAAAMFSLACSCAAASPVTAAWWASTASSSWPTRPCWQSDHGCPVGYPRVGPALLCCWASRPTVERRSTSRGRAAHPRPLDPLIAS